MTGICRRHPEPKARDIAEAWHIARKWQVMSKTGCVYILGSASLMLYVGVTSDLERRMLQHKAKALPGFAAKYRIDRLLYREFHDTMSAAIEREKRIKSWRREKKLALIDGVNPDRNDLAAGWFDAGLIEEVRRSAGRK